MVRNKAQMSLWKHRPSGRLKRRKAEQITVCDDTNGFHHRLARDASPVAANNVIQWFAGGQTIEHPGNFDARVLECGPSAAYTAGAHNMLAERMVSIDFSVEDFVHKLAHNPPLRARKGIESLFR